MVPSYPQPSTALSVSQLIIEGAEWSPAGWGGGHGAQAIARCAEPAAGGHSFS